NRAPSVFVQDRVVPACRRKCLRRSGLPRTTAASLPGSTRADSCAKQMAKAMATKRRNRSRTATKPERADQRSAVTLRAGRRDDRWFLHVVKRCLADKAIVTMRWARGDVGRPQSQSAQFGKGF